MKHNYTDDELLEAFEKSEPLKLGVYKGLRAFLDALPERLQAQPGPWPGQQEAIDAAFQQIDEFYLDYKSSHDDWEHEAPARLAIAQAYDKARPQAAEIASLKAALLQAQEAAKDLLAQRDKAQAELAALRQPVLADDGRSLGQVAMKASFDADTDGLTVDECYEAAAQAVAAVVLAQAVRRMEAVPQEEIWKVYKDDPHPFAQKALESVRARLLAAAKGEGQAKPVVVNEPPQDEKQPDLSGESEKQDPYARLKAYAKAGARIRTHDTEWTNDVDWSWCLRPEHYEVHPDDLHMCPEYAPQAEPPQPWTPTVGQTVRSTPEMALGGQMYWRDLAIQLARVWWKCHNIGASLQHGDLNKDIAFSIVCERHGGRVFHGDTPENAWHKAEEWLLSPDRENFPAACLTPAKP
jgi:hypothetical protein